MAIYPQPRPAPAIFERKARKRERDAHEDDVKAEVKRRDGHKCRWPHCRFNRYRVEAAHLDGSGMGGDPNGDRMVPENLILLCWLHHQGPVCLEHHDLKVEPLTKAGCNGPVEFYERAKRGWRLVARERAVGILEK